MVGTQYGLIDWYMDKIDFDNFLGDNRDDVLTKSADKFFEEMKEYAMKKSTGSKKESIKDNIKKDDWREKIASVIESDANQWFNDKLKNMIDESDIPDNSKSFFKKNISKYDSFEDLNSAIKETLIDTTDEVYNELNEQIKEQKITSLSKLERLQSEYAGTPEEFIIDEIRGIKESTQALLSEINIAEKSGDMVFVKELESTLESLNANSLRSLKGWRTRRLNQIQQQKLI